MRTVNVDLFLPLLGSEFLTAVITKLTVLWDVTACSLVEVPLRFGGKYCLHIRGRIVSQASNQGYIPEAALFFATYSISSFTLRECSSYTNL
jgi:hypothetical protein